MYQNTIGNKIRDLRVARNLTQAELGKVVGVSMQAVSKWERGGLPDIGVLITLADFFHVSLDEMLGRKSHDECSINDMIYDAVLHASPEEAFERACGFCWSAVKGTTGIPDLEAMGYNPTQNMENSRCRIATNAGIAHGILTEDIHMLSILPTPKGGQASDLGNLNDYVNLFRFLGDSDTLQLFYYIGTKTQTLFSKQLVVQETGISESKVDQVFEVFAERGWLTVETADTDTGCITLYRTFYQPSHVFFLLYARELLLNPRFWYLSSCSLRTTPLLNSN